jgi:hypothetical protein
MNIACKVSCFLRNGQEKGRKSLAVRKKCVTLRPSEKHKTNDYPQSPDSARRGKCDKGTGKVWECSVQSATKVRGKVKIPTGFDKIASGFIKIASGFVKIPSGLYIFSSNLLAFSCSVALRKRPLGPSAGRLFASYILPSYFFIVTYTF